MIGPQAGSMLARVRVVGQAESTTLVALTIREAPDRVCVVLVQDLAQDSLRGVDVVYSCRDTAL
jgi:hypothetical protein